MRTVNRQLLRTHGCTAALVLRLVAATFVAGATPSAAQSSSAIDETGRLESVDVRIANPSKDGALNDRIISKIRAGLGRFPDDLFSRTAAEFNLAGARRGAPISIHGSAQWSSSEPVFDPEPDER